MGARPRRGMRTIPVSPEVLCWGTGRARRYRDPVRRLWSVGVLALVVLPALLGTSGCSGGSGGGGFVGAQSPGAACALIGRLAQSAEPLLETGPEDPEAFTRALDAAVADFLTTLDSLREAVPDDLTDDVEELAGLVEQHRFQDAIEVRAALDEYARRSC
jgi:hypothetical protein